MIVLLLISNISFLFAENQEEIERKVEKKVAKSEFDTILVDHYIMLAGFFYSFDIEKPLKFLEQANYINSKYNLNRYSQIEEALGTVFARAGNIDQAMKHFANALDKLIKDKKNNSIVNVYLNLGNIYYQRQMYNLAYQTYLKSIPYFDQNTQNIRLQAVTYNNIALSLAEQVSKNNDSIKSKNYENSKFDEIKEYLNKSLNIRLQLKDSILIAHSYYYLADLFKYKDPKFSLESINNAWNYLINGKYTNIGIDDADYAKVSIIVTRAKIALMRKDNEMFISSKNFIDSLLKTSHIPLVIEKKWFETLAEVNLELKNYKVAEENYLKAQEVILKIKNPVQTLDSYQKIRNLYKLMKKHDLYLEYSEKYYNLRDSLESTDFKDKTNAIAEIEHRMAFENKSKQLEDEKKSEEKLKFIIIVIGFTSTFIGLAIAFVLFRKNKNKQKTNDELNELNATKDKFFSIIAHDLKNPIANLIQLTTILENDYDEIPEQDKREFIKAIDNSSNQIFNLLENLLTWSRSQRGKIEFYPQTNDLYYLIQNTIELLRQSAINKHIILDNKVPVGTTATFDTNMMLTVIRNLISNAIKYTPRGGTINITSHKDEKFVYIAVEDNGIGIEPKRVNNLFKIDSTQSTPGTNEEKGTGLGLILCKDFILKHNGELKVQSIIGEGTTFEFSLPLN